MFVTQEVLLMADFRGGDVVVVPLPVKPEMVVWALPGPAGEIPYADVEALVDAEFDERIDTMTQLEQSTTQAAASATAAADDVAAAVPGVNQARDQAVQAADTATQQASIASDSASAAADAAEVAEQYALDFDLDVAATTGEPGSLATVEISGTGPAYQITFSIPRGEKGAKGDDGEITQAQLDAAVASLVDNAPEALDTLHELAAALGNDPNFATTTATEIGKRVLIDGAPAEYNTLGKLVTALQNHELGGSTDASLLTGALTDQVEAADARVSGEMWIPWEEESGPFSVSLAEVAESALHAHYMVDAGLPTWIANVFEEKADADHTHDGSDITGALTSDVDASQALVTYQYWDPDTEEVGSETISLGPAISSALSYGSSFQLLADELESKSDVGHTHTPGSLGAVAASGAAATLWAGSQSEYDALPEATRNAVGFVAVIV